MAEKYTHNQAVAALKRLAKRWPKTLWLFSASGTLCVMEKTSDGQVAMTEESNSSFVDPDFCIAEIDIENDGGDW